MLPGATNRWILINGLWLVLAGGCLDDRNQIDPRNPNLISLNYDGDNVSAPTLDAGSYEGAIRFQANQLSQLIDAELIEIRYFLALLPDQGVIKIYGGTADGIPGPLLYSADVTDNLQSGTWNAHRLTTALTLTGQDIWISFAFSLSNSRATLGCDSGPAFENGDWLYRMDDGQWMPLNQRTPVNINWNLRALVQI